MATTDKPVFKAPPPPLKLPEDPPKQTASPPPLQANNWQPLDTSPQDPEARFVVRATVLGKDGKTHVPVPGTETIVRYRMSRKMVGRKWAAALTIIDDRLGTKLGFRPTEWNPYIPPPKKPNA